jgi:hypothetical protein
VAGRVVTLRELNRATIDEECLRDVAVRCARSRDAPDARDEALAALSRSVQRELEDEAGRLEAFLANRVA